jgi:outer membrane murein-binding lipoprotein Lpp
MLFSPYRKLILAIVTLISLFVTGCSESKLDQCNKMIQVLNNANDEIKALQKVDSQERDDAKKRQTAKLQLTKIAEAVDKYAKQTQDLRVEDPKLQALQKSLAGNYEQTRDNSRELLAGIEKNDPKAIQEVIKKFMTGTAQEEKVMAEFKAYCPQTPPSAPAK